MLIGELAAAQRDHKDSISSPLAKKCEYKRSMINNVYLFLVRTATADLSTALPGSAIMISSSKERIKLSYHLSSNYSATKNR